MCSPYEILYQSPPSYSHLRTFGSPCYPWQVPQRSSKLHINAPPCIFVGYSPQHKGYKCFNSTTNKIIISRHVLFHEALPSPQTPPIQPTPQITPLPPLLLPLASAQPTCHSPPNHHTIPPAPPITLPSPISTATNSSASTPPFHSPSASSSPPPPIRTHPMLTRQQTGHNKPKPILDLHHTTTPDYTPQTFSQANAIPAWREAMHAEIQALHQQGTWSLVTPPVGQPILGSKWTFKLKRNSDGTIARLVAQGFTQTYDLDYDKTFSPVATLPTIRLFFATALHNSWPIQQLDISNAFLHGIL